MARQANITATFTLATFANLCRPQKCSAAVALFPTMVVKSGETVEKTREEIMEEIQNLEVGQSVSGISLTKSLGDVTLADLFDEKGEKVKKGLEGDVTIANLKKFAREWAEAFEAQILKKLAAESNEGKAEIARMKAEKENGEPDTESKESDETEADKAE